MDGSTSTPMTPEQEQRFKEHVAVLKARSGRIVEAVAARVPTTTVEYEEWAWRLRVPHRGQCLLRRDSLWLSVLPVGQGADFVTFTKDTPDDSIVEHMVTLMERFPPAPPPEPEPPVPMPPTDPIDPLPPPPVVMAAVRKAVAKRGRPMPSGQQTKVTTGGIRKAELRRLQADGKIFKRYRK